MGGNTNPTLGMLEEEEDESRSGGQLASGQYGIMTFQISSGLMVVEGGVRTGTSSSDRVYPVDPDPDHSVAYTLARTR